MAMMAAEMVSTTIAGLLKVDIRTDMIESGRGALRSACRVEVTYVRYDTLNKLRAAFTYANRVEGIRS